MRQWENPIFINDIKNKDFNIYELKQELYKLS